MNTNYKSDTVYQKVLSTLTAQFDDSLLCRFLTKVKLYVLSIKSRFFGAFFLSLGIYSVIYSLLNLLVYKKSFDSSFYIGVVVLFASIPLINSTQNLAHLITDSRIGSYLCDFIDIRREKLNIDSLHGITAIGFIVGALSGFFSINLTLKVIGIVVLSSLVILYPVTGYMLITACLVVPFSHSFLTYSYIITIFSVILKFVRSKIVFSKNSYRLVSLILPLVVYTLIQWQFSNLDSSYFYISVLCFFSPAVLNKARKVLSVEKSLVISVSLYSIAHLFCYVLNLLTEYTPFNGLGINWAKYAYFSDSKTILALISIVLLFSLIFSKNRHADRKFISFLLLIFVIASTVFCSGFKLAFNLSYWIKALQNFNFVPLSLVVVYATFLIVQSIVFYSTLKKYELLTLSTNFVFKKYDFRHYLVCYMIIALVCVAYSLFYTQMDRLYQSFILLTGLFAAYTNLFYSDVCKSSSAELESQNGFSASVDL